MMSETPNTIRLEVPKDRIAADLRGLARHLAKAATQGALLQNWPGVVANLLEAAGTIRVARNEGALAWKLLLTGIGEALTELTNDQPLTLINKADADYIAERVGCKAADLIIPVDFLDHPLSLPPVALAKETLLAWLAPPRGSAPHQDLVNLGHRFDSAFVLGLHRTILRDEAYYRPLLALRETPTGLAWQVLEDWRLYRARLVADFEATPVFDESFALERVYVPLNAWHSGKQKSDVRTAPKGFRVVVRLTDDMLAWLRGERSNGRLRLVSGGPGSGKSSAMKALAAELAKRGNKDHPTDVLLFPLQRFQWRSGIMESVGATLNAYDDQMRHNPLHPDHLRERQTPLLLIFDGLDELTSNTEVSEAISATVLRELSTALRNWADRPVWAIVTGRDAIFGNVEGPTTALPGERFRLLPYHVREFEPQAPGRRDYHDPDGLLQSDHRAEAFRRFAAAKGEPSDSLPSAYENDDLHDVSAQPLLNYFLLTSGSDKVVDGNVARIYSHLFQRLHDRNRNIDDRPQDAGKPGAGLSPDLFDRVFEAMAVAAWRTGGTRAASWEEVQTEADREDSYLQHGQEKLRNVLDSQMQDRGAQKPFRLAAAFFMRNQQATGVEFTHKSFGDYLYARRLAKALVAMADGLSQMPAVEPEMLRRWGALTAEQRMSPDIRGFLELEVEATVDVETLSKWHETLAPVVERVFRDGWQVAGETLMRRAEQRSSQMEEALFVAWHALWRAIGDGRYWTLGSNTGDLLYRALARQRSAHGLHNESVFVRSWSGADLRGADLSGADLSVENFDGLNLRAANLEDANLLVANLSGAILTGASLRGANLVGAFLGGANLIQANLSRANLEDADLRGAILIGANLEDACLPGANLEDAELGSAKLHNTHLGGGNFSRANLEDADLRGANLEDADLSGANLSGANLEDADLTGANLEDAEFGDA